jgi:hypothetical protein
MSRSLLKLMKKKGGENEEVKFGYRISLNLLHAKFKKLDDNAATEDVVWYT